MDKPARATVCDTDIQAYPWHTSIALRYGDTDRQGHVNNAVFCTLLESGRVDFLFRDGLPVSGPGTAFVIAKLSLDYLQEMNFPGVAKVGSKILSMGKSSFVIGQAIFLNGQCCSTAQSVIVQIDENTKRPLALTESLKEVLTVVKS